MTAHTQRPTYPAGMDLPAFFDRHPWTQWTIIAAVLTVGALVYWGDEITAQFRTADVGQPVVASGFEHVVHDVDCNAGRCTVTMTVTNVGDGPSTWYANTLLIDTEGRTHEGSGRTRTLNPGVQHEATLIYTVPDGITPARLTVNPNLFGSSGPTVRLFN